MPKKKSPKPEKVERAESKSILWAPESWPKGSSPAEHQKEDRDFPKTLYGFVVEGEDRNGGCPEHPYSSSVLVRDYVYLYPDGSARRISLGWVCKECLKRGWTRDGEEKVTIASPSEVREKRVPRY